jgi:hypothetical protein
MKKMTVLVLSLIFLCLEGTPPAQAQNTVPNEMLGTWSVSKTGSDMNNMFESTNGEKVIWIFKPDAENHLIVEAYGIGSMGQSVYPKDLQISAPTYNDGKTELNTIHSMGGFNTADTYSITWSFREKSSSGFGTYANYSKIDGMENVFAFIGAPNVDPWTYNGGGTVQLKKISSSQKPPKPKAMPAAPPSFNMPQAAPMPFMMPSPTPIYGSPSRSFDYTPQRNTSYCGMNKITCSSGCDPPSYGLAKDYNRINSCRADCEQTYSSCMRQ